MSSCCLQCGGSHLLTFVYFFYFDFALLLVLRPDYTVRLGRPSLRPPILAFITLSLFGNKVFSIQRCVPDRRGNAVVGEEVTSLNGGGGSVDMTLAGVLRM